MDPMRALVFLQSDFVKIGVDRDELGWTFEPCPPDSTTFRVGLMAMDKEVYWFRFIWDGYPDEEPSIVCVDPKTGDYGSRAAWPDCDGSRPGDGFCMNFTREALRRLHIDWSQNGSLRWKAEGNPLQTVLYAIYFGILRDPKHYRGRMK